MVEGMEVNYRLNTSKPTNDNNSAVSRWAISDDKEDNYMWARSVIASIEMLRCSTLEIKWW
ncbi:hypothetical protein SESBI_17739 [Sesbania bispinosa]|nr:hypothetical protein SESBI_17739 [Sesbania bispinosa]